MARSAGKINQVATFKVDSKIQSFIKDTGLLNVKAQSLMRQVAAMQPLAKQLREIGGYLVAIVDESGALSTKIIEMNTHKTKIDAARKAYKKLGVEIGDVVLASEKAAKSIGRGAGGKWIAKEKALLYPLRPKEADKLATTLKIAREQEAAIEKDRREALKIQAELDRKTHKARIENKKIEIAADKKAMVEINKRLKAEREMRLEAIKQMKFASKEVETLNKLGYVIRKTDKGYAAYIGTKRKSIKYYRDVNRLIAEESARLKQLSIQQKKNKPIMEYAIQILKRVAIAYLSIHIIRSVGRWIGDFGKRLITMNTELDSLTIRLTTLYGTVAKAQEALVYLKKYALYTPFIIKDLFNAAVALRGFNVQIKNNIEAIGDWSAAVGSDVKETAAAFGKIVIGSARTALLLSTRGMNIKTYRAYIEEYKDRTTALAKYIEDRYGGMAKNVSHTFEGIVSNIKDAVDFIAAGIGIRLYNSVKNIASGFQDWARQLVDNNEALDRWAKTLSFLAKITLPAISAGLLLIITQVGLLGKAIASTAAIMTGASVGLGWPAILAAVAGLLIGIIANYKIIKFHQRGIIAQEKEWKEALETGGTKSKIDSATHLIELTKERIRQYDEEIERLKRRRELLRTSGITTTNEINKAIKLRDKQIKNLKEYNELLEKADAERWAKDLEEARMRGAVSLTNIIKYAKEDVKGFRDAVTQIIQGLEETRFNFESLAMPGLIPGFATREDIKENVRTTSMLVSLRKMLDLGGNMAEINKEIKSAIEDAISTGMKAPDLLDYIISLLKIGASIIEEEKDAIMDYSKSASEIAKAQRGRLLIDEALGENEARIVDILGDKITLSEWLNATEEERIELFDRLFSGVIKDKEEREKVKEIEKRLVSLTKENIKYHKDLTSEAKKLAVVKQKMAMAEIRYGQALGEGKILAEKLEVMNKRGYLTKKDNLGIELESLRLRKALSRANIEDYKKSIEQYELQLKTKMEESERVNISREIKELQTKIVGEENKIAEANIRINEAIQDYVKNSVGMQLVSKAFSSLGSSIADYISKLLFSSEEAERIARINEQIESLRLRLAIIRGEKVELSEEEQIIQQIAKLENERRKKTSQLKDLANAFYQELVRTALRLVAEIALRAAVLAIEKAITREYQKRAAIQAVGSGFGIIGKLATLPFLLAQHGYHGWVSQPTLIMAGEKGRERIDVSPEGTVGSSNTVHIHFNGDIYGWEDFRSKVDEANKEIARYRA